jgi:hypothetical protein
MRRMVGYNSIRRLPHQSTAPQESPASARLVLLTLNIERTNHQLWHNELRWNMANSVGPFAALVHECHRFRSSHIAVLESLKPNSMLLFAAFTVTLGTLLIQGLTLRPLALALCLRDDEDTVAREVRAAPARGC